MVVFCSGTAAEVEGTGDNGENSGEEIGSKLNEESFGTEDCIAIVGGDVVTIDGDVVVMVGVDGNGVIACGTKIFRFFKKASEVFGGNGGGYGVLNESAVEGGGGGGAGFLNDFEEDFCEGGAGDLDGPKISSSTEGSPLDNLFWFADRK